jgi:MFS family permease
MSRTRIDIALLFTTRIARLFAFGAVSVILVLYLVEAGLPAARVGLLLTLTLVGDAIITLALTTVADRIGRRRTLIASALLMMGAGVAFLLTRNPFVLLAAATLGILSPSGNEIGPFLSVEQAGLAELVPAKRRTGIFAWYNLVGSFATATGALAAGQVAQLLQRQGWTAFEAYRAILVGNVLIGLILLLTFLALSDAVEPPLSENVNRPPAFLGLRESRGVVFRLSGLFALDAFGGGFVVASIVSYWFATRFNADVATIGNIFFFANLLAGISALLAASLAARFGLINTMVFTHIPSNLLLILVPFMPTLPLAIGVLLVRFAISQMDVPTRQSYTVAIVNPDERSAAAGVTAIARSIGAAPGPWLSLLLAGSLSLAAPFVIAGTLKITYDLLLYRSFKALPPPEETASPGS